MDSLIVLWLILVFIAILAMQTRYVLFYKYITHDDTPLSIGDFFFAFAPFNINSKITAFTTLYFTDKAETDERELLRKKLNRFALGVGVLIFALLTLTAVLIVIK